MGTSPKTSAEIRQSFLDFFESKGHAVVPSMSLVPGGDQTLLFTNAGMVQFKDVFLGTGTRPYTRAADSQKCMRVAGKHNDLDDVGRDDTHHTFFEMLGNWSFGDYYKKEAIEWAWELLTEVWQLPREDLWATCFEDELGEIPRDDEAAEIWLQQPGFVPEHLLFFGREENFWEMADTGPSGPDSEIHLDRGPEYCDRADESGHICRVNGDCQRFLELWNLVFIQYNRKSPDDLEPLPARHVDTGMGFERLVSVIQDVNSNYRTDLFTPLLDEVQSLTGDDDDEREANFTPYRVIGDHARAAAFLIADGVVPGNVGRNYVCRMIIRRASRFGSTIGLSEPFLATIADRVISEYAPAYPELDRNRKAILQTITDEETRFHRTVDTGISYLDDLIEEIRAAGETIIPGDRCFDLYATYGLPLEITRDIAREHSLEVDEEGFHQAMETHRLASGGGRMMGVEQPTDTRLYMELLAQLQENDKLEKDGVRQNPYGDLTLPGIVLALIQDGENVTDVKSGDTVAVVISSTPFYVESGGQVSDSGFLQSEAGWTIRVDDVRAPVQGLVVHHGVVEDGTAHVGDPVSTSVDPERRMDIMRNHTATHLLHAALQSILGEHARQAGSLVAPDRLRFDFTHPDPLSPDQMDEIEAWVNERIIQDLDLTIRFEAQDEAIGSGAMALFGETYGETVRTISIGRDQQISYELCGGTHVPATGAIGPFMVLNEGSVAAGIRRIEAITGRASLERVRSQTRTLREISDDLSVPVDQIRPRIHKMLADQVALNKEAEAVRKQGAVAEFQALQPKTIAGIPILTGVIEDVDDETLRSFADQFREQYPSGVAVLSSVRKDRPFFIAAVSDDLVARGLHAGNLVKAISQIVGGGGGGKAHLAQAGGSDTSRIEEALEAAHRWMEDHLSTE